MFLGISVSKEANVLWFHLGALERIGPMIGLFHTPFLPRMRTACIDRRFARVIDRLENVLSTVETDGDADSNRSVSQLAASATPAAVFAPLPASVRLRSTALAAAWSMARKDRRAAIRAPRRVSSERRR